jgi:hypothetical protein
MLKLVKCRAKRIFLPPRLLSSHPMKVRKYKILVVMLFLGVFFIKISVSIAPVFLSLNSKVVSSFILQLEQESKIDKDDPEKDVFKEKKIFDEYFHHALAYQSFLIQTSVLFNAEHHLYQQTYHPVVPTPPPNA